MTVLQVTTKSKREIVDLTRLFQKELPQIKKANGLCHLFLLHTTAALTTADLDPGTDLDLLDAFDAIIPKLIYRHPHDPGTSLLLPVKDGEPLLGERQRIVLVECDGLCTRQIAITFMLEKID